MSNKLVNMVMHAKIDNSAEKFLLWVLADTMNDDGLGAWASQSYYAHLTSLTRQTVNQKLNSLIDKGLIVRKGYTNSGTVRYQMDTEAVQALVEVWGLCEVCGNVGVTHSDHWVPKSKGGVDDAWNRVELCPPCNYDKGEALPDVWLADREPILRQINDKLAELKSVSTETVSVKTETVSDLPTETITNPLEPTYVELQEDETPNEMQMELDNFLTGWKTCFPNKTQPRASTAIKKWKPRFKNEGFRSKWRQALWATKDLPWAHEEGWFKWQWFLHNNENYQKLLDGTFDFKMSQKGKISNEPAPRRKIDTSYTIPEEVE
jgi:5-methylcytosine-specific restriction endonuclease McrA